MNRFYTRRTINIGATVTVAVILFFAWHAYRSMMRTRKETLTVNTTLRSMRAIEDLMDSIRDDELLEEHASQNLPDTPAPYLEALEKLSEDTLPLSHLQNLYPHRVQDFKTLESLIRQKLELHQTLTDRNGPGISGDSTGTQLTHQIRFIRDSIKSLAGSIEGNDRVILTSANAERQKAAISTAILYVILTSLFIATIAVLYWRIMRELREKEGYETRVAYLANLVDKATDAIVSTNKAGEIISWNSGAEKLYGYRADEVIGKIAREVIRVNTSTDEMEKWQKEVLAKGSVDLEMVHQNKKGESIDCLTSISALRNENNQVTGYVSVIRDISQRKQAETLLRQFNQELSAKVKEKTEAISRSEEKLRHVLTSTVDDFYVVDKQFVVTLINKKAEANLAAAWGRAVGMGTDILDAVPAQKRAEIEQQFLRVFKGECIEYEVQNEKPLGRSWVLVSYMPVYDEKNNITGAYVVTKDITERKKAEEELRQTNNRFELIGRTTNDAVWEWDLLTNQLWSNETHQALYGLTTKDPVPTENMWASRIHPDDRDNVVHMQEKILASTTNVFISEYRFYSEKEGYRDIYDRCYIVRDQDGKAIRMMGSMMDITERKKADSQLRESEERYRALVENAPEALVVLDMQLGCFVNVSESAEKLFKMTREEILKTGPIQVSPEYQPDGRLSSEAALEQINKAIAGEKPIFEWTHQDTDGNLIPCEVRLARLPSEKRILIRGSIIDISERKRAEEEIRKTNARFNIVSRATSDIVWDWDLLTNELWWNDNYYSNLGYRKEKEVVDIEHWFSRIHPGDLARIRSRIDKVKEGKATVWRDEYRYAQADGTYLDFLDRGYVIRDNDGKAIRMIGSMVDMTPVYNAQREVAESENRLRTILDTDPECIKLIGPETELIDINQAGMAMLEMDDLESVRGQKILSVVAEPQQEAIATMVKEAFEGKSGKMEFEMHTFKGKTRWCEINIVPFKNAEGTILYALGVTIDNTEKRKAELELKQNEEKYRTLVEQAVDAIILYDRSGAILDVNTGASILLGYTKEELTAMNLSQVLVEEEMMENPIHFDYGENGSNDPSSVKQRRLLRKDGNIVITEVRSQELTDGRFLSVVRDMSERILTEQELKASYKAVRKLTAHLQNIREEERADIAREIHDELGQQLTVLKMDVAWINKKIADPDEAMKEKLKELLAMLDNTVRTVRRISSELRPSLLDDLGLIAAMEWQLHEFEKRSGIRAALNAPEKEVNLSDPVKTALFRIFQESLTNVARHSEAKNISINLEKRKGNFVLSIVDDGKGFDRKKVTEKRTLGLLGMNERTMMIGGRYEIISAPGKGTKVSVTVPLSSHE